MSQKKWSQGHVSYCEASPFLLTVFKHLEIEMRVYRGGRVFLNTWEKWFSICIPSSFTFLLSWICFIEEHDKFWLGILTCGRSEWLTFQWVFTLWLVIFNYRFDCKDITSKIKCQIIIFLICTIKNSSLQILTAPCHHPISSQTTKME